MVKSYLRYDPLVSAGVVASPTASVVYAPSGASVYLPALDRVYAWDGRTGAPLPGYNAAMPAGGQGSRRAPAHVTALGVTGRLPNATAPGVMAVGYADGNVRTFAVGGDAGPDSVARTHTAEFRAHRGAVRALAFGAEAPHVGGEPSSAASAHSSLLATGGDDTTAAVWDLLSESPVSRLKGHTAPVTGAAFVVASNGALRLLTTSKDGTLRAWDPLERKMCTLRVRAAEHALAALAVSPSGDRVIVAGAGGGGGASVFALHGSAPSAAGAAEADEDGELVLLSMGAIKPPPLPAAMALAQPRAADATVDTAAIDASGTFLVTLSGASKAGVRVYRRRSAEEVARQRKRRAKRKLEKQKKKGAASDAAGTDDADESALTADIEWEHVAVVQTAAKPRSVALQPTASGGGRAGRKRGAAVAALGGALPPAPNPLSIAVTLTNNAFEFVQVPVDVDGDEQPAPHRTKLVERLGHRHGARCIGFGDDDGATVVTGGHGGLKCWALERYHALAGGFDVDDEDGGGGSGGGRDAAPLTCVRTASLGSNTVTCVLVAPGSRHAVACTKEGGLYVVELSSGTVVDEHSDAHAAADKRPGAAAITGIAAHPDGGGFTTCGIDGTVKVWEWVARKVPTPASEALAEKSKKTMRRGGDDDSDDDGAPSAPARGPMEVQLSAEHVRSLQMDDECMAVHRVGPLLAVALLNSTIQVVRAGTLELAYSLYGHKLPVTCIASDSDVALIATGSGDKSLRLWGVDFGDCRRTLRPAHDAGLTGVAFVPQTHHIFTCARDGLVKYWDGDTGEHLLTLPGHGPEEVWALSVSGDGAFLASVGQDRSVRVWERTEEPFFAEEEREARVEALLDTGAEDRMAAADPATRRADKGTDGDAADDDAPLIEARSARRTLDAMGAADDIAAALELAAEEEKRVAESAGKKRAVAPNPMLLGQSPTQHVLRTLRNVRTPDLEAVFCSLPYHATYDLLERIAHALTVGERKPFVPTELAEEAPPDQRRVTCDEHLVRCASLLVRLHKTPLAASSRGTSLLQRIREPLRTGAREMRDMAAYNMSVIERLLK